MLASLWSGACAEDGAVADALALESKVEQTSTVGVRPVNATCRAPSRPSQGPLASGGPAARLSETGCVRADDPSEPADGLIFYDVNAPLWSDGADKRRWLALPDGARIVVAEDDDWELPVGSVLVKSFHLAGRPIETRLLVRHDDGDWAGYSYAWRADGSDADLLDSSLRRTFAGQEWTYPSRQNCLECHTAAAGRSLGLETAQLDRDVASPEGPENQLDAWVRMGMFAQPLRRPPPLLSPTSDAGTLEARARSYLHANCASCHRPGVVKGVALDLRYATSLAATHACDVPPAKGNFGFLGARILKPGDPDLSMLSIRMHTTIASVLMPQVGRARTDVQGVAVIDAFIAALSTCP